MPPGSPIMSPLSLALRMQVRMHVRCPAHSVMLSHVGLCCARQRISYSDNSGGRSMKKPPADCLLNCIHIARTTSLFPRVLRMCPSHFMRRCRIASTRSYDLVFELASLCASLPVKRLSILAFAPLMVALARSSKSHASLP